MKKEIMVIGIIFLVITVSLSGCTNNDTTENGQFRINTFEISPKSIYEGETAILTWDVSNADTVSIEGIGIVVLKGLTVVTPTEDTTYKLTAVKDGMTLNATTFIKIITPPKENAGVAVITESSMIKIVLTNGGDNMDPTGYTEDQIRIFNNGSELAETNIAGLTWEVGESLWIGGNGGSPNVPELEDDKGSTIALNPGVYIITVEIVDTEIYDNSVIIA